MPRSINTQVENNFIGGLITEATALNFPENACTETDNCIFHPKGSVYRRPGIDFENNYTVAPFDYTGVITQFLWTNPGGTNRNFLCIQSSKYLYFIDVTDDQALSRGWRAYNIDFSTYATDNSNHPVKDYECQFAVGQGFLFVVHPYAEPFYVKYDPATNVISHTGITIYVRDTDGVVDETLYSYDTRPTSLTDKHTYNLYNQGWFPTSYNTNYILDPGGVPFSTGDYIWNWRHQTGFWTTIAVGNPPTAQSVFTTTSFGRTDYPANADIYWLMRAADNSWNNNLADINKRGNTPAPKGYFVMNAFNMDRVAASTITVGSTSAGGSKQGLSIGTVVTLPTVPSTTSGVNRPSTVAFYGGRVFYAGCNATGYSNKIFFTQVIKSEEQFGRCHQLNDPTNDKLFELLATDGGTVTIPEAGQIIKMFSIQTSLLIFATNGIWVIAGNQGIGFSAGDYTIRKVSSVPAVSASSFVDVEGLPVWWNNDGIYMVSEVNAAGGVKVDSLTQSTIRKYYTEKIPVESKLYAKGAYSQLTKEIRWVFRSVVTNSVTMRYEYDRVLCFNVQTKAFYPWSLLNNNVKVNGISCLKTQGTNDGTTTLSASVFKFFSSYDNSGRKGTFSEAKDLVHYKDFFTYNSVGEDYTSYFVTGYKLATGQASRKFQSNYITIFASNIGNPQLYLQSQWNFGSSEASGRWGSNQLLMFPETDASPLFDYVMRKVKVRGSGKALQLRFSSVSGKPFELAGWSRFETTNAGI